jgi:hypothetical protein
MDTKLESTMFAEHESGARLRQLQLERAIERQIVRRTWGRVRALEVEVTDNRIIVHGRAVSYYLYQLALRGILEVIESPGAMQIEMKIQVCSPSGSGRGTVR